MIQSQHLNQ